MTILVTEQLRRTLLLLNVCPIVNNIFFVNLMEMFTEKSDSAMEGRISPA